MRSHMIVQTVPGAWGGVGSSKMNAWYVLISSIAFLGAIYAAACYIFAQLTLNPKRRPIVASPSDYGLP
jgi:hypothetical protein